MRSAEGPSEIARLGRRRQITILANPAPGVGESTVEAGAEDRGGRSHIAPFVLVRSRSGRSKAIVDTAGNFVLAFSLSFIFMYLILAGSSNRGCTRSHLLRWPLTIPSRSCPSTFSTRRQHHVGARPFGLFGVVKKNSILQIDTNHLRERASSEIQRSSTRTAIGCDSNLDDTLAFVAGIIPLILGPGIGRG